MQLQKQQSGGLEHQPDVFIVRVNDYLYKVWSDIALAHLRAQLPLRERQTKMFTEIRKWSDVKYPGYGMVAFEDYSSYEAKELSRRLDKDIKWGMYIMFQKNGSMTPVQKQNLLEQGHPQIEM
jgi:hypothetical protein